MTPLPNKPNPIEMSQLRPINIFPWASKIIERVICEQLSDAGESTFLVLLDFYRAFDCISIPLVLYKMSY
jgi:hypothetical protein